MTTLSDRGVDDRADDLCALLVGAHAARTQIENLPAGLVPADAAAARRVQRDVLARRGQRVQGWKVGAKSPTGPIQGAPLPADTVRPSPAGVRLGDFPVLGLELEIAFLFGRAFPLREQPYADGEVMDGVKSMLATIEIVSSRYAQWPEVDALAQLADLQSHGALVFGQAVAYAPDFDFATPRLDFRADEADVVQGRAPGNPAGDPRRLLPWLVNHAAGRGWAVGEDTIVTTGSYSGLHLLRSTATVAGRIEGLPPVILTIS
jgi:2-keto-4-pentenoate hydratase